MNTLGMTHSVCGECRQLVPAKLVIDGDEVWFHKFCPQHGQSQNFVRSNVQDYLHSLRYVKPAWVPRKHAGDTSANCPQGCGYCERHEQHLCLPIIEITSRCNLACPICLVDAGRDWDMTMEEFERLLDDLIATERQIDIVNLSGGEPLLHPELLQFIDTALDRPEVIRISISTNGLALLDNPELLHELHQRNVVISLQFDGFDDGVYRRLRGRSLLEKKRQILDALGQANVSTSLTVTVAGGVNEDQLPRIVDHLFSQPHIISMMIQPLCLAGRAASFAGQAKPLSVPDILRILDTTSAPRIATTDFAPLPCSHPLCFNLAYYLMLDDGGSVSLNRLVDAAQMMDSLANRTIFGLDADEHERLKDMIYDLWSGPAGVAPDTEAVMRTLRGILDEMTCACFDPRRAFHVTERRIKSIFIHAFQDVNTFDLARVRRCCNAYPQPDGKLMPVCVHNVLQRHV